MATTTNASAATSASTVEGSGYNVVCKPVTLTVSVNPTATESVGMIKIPAHAIVLDVIVVASDMDVHATPTIAFSVGTDASPHYWLNASTIGRAGGLARPTALTARPLTFDETDTINITWGTAAATFAAGTIDLMVTYVNP